MKYIAFFGLVISLSIVGCDNISESGPFEQSTDRCKSWSSLQCSGVEFMNQNAATMEQLTLGEFLGRSKDKIERIRYLNGWSPKVTLETVIKVKDAETIWIATDGFLPEEFPKYQDKYSFAEEDCAAQIKDGKRNGFICTYMPDSIPSILGGDYVKGFLKLTGSSRTLEEFIEMNKLPRDTTLSSRIVVNRFYKMGKWE